MCPRTRGLALTQLLLRAAYVLAKTRRHARFHDEGAQGECGRGLVSKQHVRCAEPIFEEAPIVVVSTDRTDANFERQRLFARFEAYTILGQMAEGGGQAAAQAISAFHELTPNGEMQPELVAAANAILPHERAARAARGAAHRATA